MTQAVRFLTESFVASRQTQPRGRGAWGFQAYAEPSESGHLIITPSLTYGEAKRCAAVVARNVYPAAAEIFIEVLP